MFDFMHYKVTIKKLKEGSMKKHLLIGSAIIVLLLCVAVTPSLAQSNGKCTIWYWDWTGTGSSFTGPAYLWLDSNGTFINDFSETGTWNEFDGSRYLSLMMPHIVSGQVKRQGALCMILMAPLPQELSQVYGIARGPTRRTVIGS